MPPALGPLAPTSDHTVTGVERSTGAGTYYSHVDDNPASGQPDADYLSIRSIPFVPTSLTGLVAWYDMSDTATITASAGAVSQLDDKSGNAYHVVQATAAAKPTTGTRTVNSLNVLDFDGGDRLVKATTPAVNASTIFVVAVFDTFATSNRVVFGGPTNNFSFGATLTTGTIRAHRGGTAASGTTGMSTGTPYLLTASYGTGGGANADGWLNATQEITNGSVGSQNTVGIQISGANGANSLLDGALGEVVIYDSVLGTTDRETVRDYLNAKWACY